MFYFLGFCFSQMNPLHRSQKSVVQPFVMFQEESILWKEIHGTLIRVPSVHVIMQESYVKPKFVPLYFVEILHVLKTHVVPSVQVSFV